MFGALQEGALRLTQRISRAEILKQKAESVETLLYGCVAWTALKQHLRQLYAIHHLMLLCVTASCLSPRTKHRVLPRRVSELADCNNSTEATVRKRRLIWAGRVVRSAAKRLYRGVMLGELKGPPLKDGQQEL